MTWRFGQFRGLIHKFALAAGLASLVAACATTSYDPASVRPTFTAKNTPRSNPKPSWKPALYKIQSKARSNTGSTITVKKGQTLYAISRIYGVSVQNLVAQNGLRPPYRLSVGQRLKLSSPRVHVVRKGDTGYSISRRYGVTVSRLMEVNRIRPPYSLSVGQKLRLPGGASVQVASNSQTRASSRPSSRSSSKSSGATSRAPAAKPRQGRSSKVSSPPPPARTGSRFSWPVEGQLAARFGPKEGGLHNDGINILAKNGTPVKAAEAGVVVYSSNELAGYGNLLLIKHGGGFVTAYAHNERLLVKKGDKVERGTVIARVGRSGGVVKPQLHFEIRKGRKALNPLHYLARKTASAR